MTSASVADLTFLSATPRVIHRNVKSKATLESYRRPGGIARLGCRSPDRSGVEGVMTKRSGRLVIRCIVAISMTAISIGTMDSAVAQSRIGQIGRDGLTNRHEAPTSETELLLRLDM